MLTVRRNRQFMCAGHYWTIWVECKGMPRGPHSQLGVEWVEFWQWLTDHVTTLPADDGHLLTPQQGGKLQTLGDEISANPHAFTAERMAMALLASFRDISAHVSAVTVLLSLAAGHADNTVEATARSDEPLTAEDARFIFRHFAHQNRLVFDPSDTWPREVVNGQ